MEVKVDYIMPSSYNYPKTTKSTKADPASLSLVSESFVVVFSSFTSRKAPEQKGLEMAADAGPGENH